jgi:hypothetical protein
MHGWGATAAEVFGKAALAVTAVVAHPAATQLTDTGPFTCEASIGKLKARGIIVSSPSARRRRGGIRGLQGSALEITNDQSSLCPGHTDFAARAAELARYPTWSNGYPPDRPRARHAHHALHQQWFQTRSAQASPYRAGSTT